MNSIWVSCLALVAATTISLATSRSAGPYSVNDTTDSGGLRVTSANYDADGSIGAIGGFSSNSPPPVTVRHGYIGQLTEVSNLAVIAAPASMNESGASQLSALASLDDATVVVLAGSNVVWSAPTYPVNSIGADGVVTAGTVYANTPGVVTGRYFGVTGSGVILVLDSDPDNCGIYASDQIPDWWQVGYFGTNNPSGMAGATNCSGENNLYSYTADLNPTDSNSALRVVAISNQPLNRAICFGSTSTARVYRLLYTTNLVEAVWTNLPGATWASGQAAQMSLTDTNATAIRFYRVHVQVP